MIEVKAVSKYSFKFYWSANELNNAKELGDRYYLYLLPMESKKDFKGLQIVKNPFKNVINNPTKWEQLCESHCFKKNKNYRRRILVSIVSGRININDREILNQPENKYTVALKIALQTGYLTECEICSEIYNPIEDPTDVYKLANTLITKNAALVKIFKGNRKQLTDILKKIPNDYSVECQCDRIKNRND